MRVDVLFKGLTAGLIAAALAGAARAQSADWLLRSPGEPAGRSSHATTYDSARGEVIVFGGTAQNQLNVDDTWRWNGTTWIPQPATTHGAGRLSHSAMAYDSERGRAVLFGGYDGSFPNNRTWEWDGRRWTERTPAASPPARSRHAMAYDSARGRVVLFGGYNSGWSGDTWEWDGNNWVQRTPATSPPSRYGHAMAYDSARGRVVLFGGFGGSFKSDTWEWDGTNWEQRTPLTSPVARYEQAMAYDSARARVVMFGGSDGTNGLAETWEWDGSAWTLRTPAVSPSARHRISMAYDSARGRVVLFGGYLPNPAGNFRTDTWEWDGTVWVQRLPNGPPGRHDFGMAYDDARARVVLFGGHGDGYLSDTWEWDGGTWVLRTTGVAPSARYGHTMAYDGARGRVMLFGGREPTGALVADTWEWDGTSWAQRSPPTSPPARYLHRMAYDAARGRIVLFGGLGTASSLFGDTWEWDGNTWIPSGPGASPSPRYLHAMAYDSARHQVLLFGGSNGSTGPDPYLADTWAWNGSVWTQQATAFSPQARSSHAMAYDPIRDRVVMFGGYNFGARSDTWEWNGTTWSLRTPATQALARYGHSMVYDPGRGRLMSFAGSVSSYPSDIWEYGPIASCGSGQSVFAFLPGAGGSASATSALGTPDAQAAALGIEGSVVLLTGGTIADGPGTDLVIRETGTSFDDGAEDYWVLVSNNGVDFVHAAECRGDVCPIDLLAVGLSHASHVRITDYVPGWPPGVEIDALTVLSCAAAVESCDGIDNDDDGALPPTEIDHDGDGFVACGPWSGNPTSVQGGGDCDETRAPVHPGAAEVCNAIDDDCNGLVDDGATPPSIVTTLMEARSGPDDVILSWSPVTGAASYDVVSGDLIAIRGSGGNFSASTSACLADDRSASWTSESDVISPGQARWHLVRARGCGQNGSYDGGGAHQVASRDSGVAASGAACP